MRLIFGALAGLALGQDKFLASAPPRELQPGGAMSCSGVDAINAPTSSSGTATSVNIDETTGRWSGTVNGVTLNSPSFTAKGAPCLGSVATTAVGNGLTYGALEAGFDGVNTPQLCMAEDTSQTTEAAISDSGGSPVTLAEFISEDLCRAFDNGALNYGLLMDECGGHANPYHLHFGHEQCAYTDTGVSATSSAGHSLILGYANDGAGYYGFFESADTLPTDLDACNGHTGKIPELGDTLVYHYHSTPYPPYTIGCYGPATMDECKDIYSSECANEDNKVVHSFALESPNDRSTIDHLLNADGALEYYRWCQCYDRPDWVNGKWANDHMGLVTAFYKHYRSIEETGGGPGETSGGTIGGSTGSTDSSSSGPGGSSSSGAPPSGDSSSSGPTGDTSSGGPSGDTSSGGPGGDTSSGGPSGDTSSGGPSGDTSSGAPSGDTSSSSGLSGDTSSGGPGGDTSSGGPGGDTSSGGPSGDTSSGGPSGDTSSGAPSDDSSFSGGPPSGDSSSSSGGPPSGSGESGSSGSSSSGPTGSSSSGGQPSGSGMTESLGDGEDGVTGFSGVLAVGVSVALVLFLQ